MTNQEAIKLLSMGRLAYNEVEAKAFCEAYNMAIEALKKEPCEDCISRQAAIDLADELKDDMPDDDRLSDMVMSHNEGILEYQTKLSLLPPVTPAGKVGHWIDHQMDIWIYAKCSECETIHDTRTNYCPHCGAKM